MTIDYCDVTSTYPFYGGNEQILRMDSSRRSWPHLIQFLAPTVSCISIGSAVFLQHIPVTKWQRVTPTDTQTVLATCDIGNETLCRFQYGVTDMCIPASLLYICTGRIGTEAASTARNVTSLSIRQRSTIKTERFTVKVWITRNFTSVQLPQLFVIPFLAQSVLPIYLTLFGATFTKQLLIPLAANWLFYKCFTYFLS